MGRGGDARGGLLQVLMAATALWMLMTPGGVRADGESIATAADDFAKLNCDASVWPRSSGQNVKYLVVPLGWADWADYAGYAEINALPGFKLSGPMPSFYSEAWAKALFASYDTQLRALLFNTTTLDLASLIVLPPFTSHEYKTYYGNGIDALALGSVLLPAIFDWVIQQGVTDCAWDQLVILSSGTGGGLAGGGIVYVGIGPDIDDQYVEFANTGLMSLLLHELTHNAGVAGIPHSNAVVTDSKNTLGFSARDATVRGFRCTGACGSDGFCETAFGKDKCAHDVFQEYGSPHCSMGGGVLQLHLLWKLVYGAVRNSQLVEVDLADCQDVPAWDDPVESSSIGCEGWAGYDCNDAFDGWSSPSVVLQACPATCGLCASAGGSYQLAAQDDAASTTAPIMGLAYRSRQSLAHITARTYIHPLALATGAGDGSCPAVLGPQCPAADIEDWLFVEYFAAINRLVFTAVRAQPRDAYSQSFVELGANYKTTFPDEWPRRRTHNFMLSFISAHPPTGTPLCQDHAPGLGIPISAAPADTGLAPGETLLDCFEGARYSFTQTSACTHASAKLCADVVVEKWECTDAEWRQFEGGTSSDVPLWLTWKVNVGGGKGEFAFSLDVGRRPASLITLWFGGAYTWQYEGTAAGAAAGTPGSPSVLAGIYSYPDGQTMLVEVDDSGTCMSAVHNGVQTYILATDTRTFHEKCSAGSDKHDSVAAVAACAPKFGVYPPPSPAEPSPSPPTSANNLYYTISPSTGACPAGHAMSESECASLHGQSVDGRAVAYNSASTWENPETCGCFFDQGGSVYFNRRTDDCNQQDAGEISICVQAPTSSATSSATSAPTEMPDQSDATLCQDAPSWTNGAIGYGPDGDGYTCSGYKEQDWCFNGAVVEGFESTTGPTFNEPELNCCVCGGSAETAPGKSAATRVHGKDEGRALFAIAMLFWILSAL
jgi:hypothetical protein